MIIDPLKPFGLPEWESAGRPAVIATPSTGDDHIDRAGLESLGVKILTLRDDRVALDEIRASSEFTFMLLLLGLRGGARIFGTRHRGDPGNELYRKLVGIIGFGRIGKNIERWCEAFGAEVAIHDPPIGYFYWSLEQVFRECDAVVVCCTFDEDTRGMIGSSLLETMKPGAVLVNTSRGGVLVEDELVLVLRARPDLRVMLDVLDGELDWRHLNSPLWKLATVTAHIAGHAVEAEAKALRIAQELENRATITTDGGRQ